MHDKYKSASPAVQVKAKAAFKEYFKNMTHEEKAKAKYKKYI
jgi:hypothetical protein